MSNSPQATFAIAQIFVLDSHCQVMLITSSFGLFALPIILIPQTALDLQTLKQFQTQFSTFILLALSLVVMDDVQP